MSGLTIPTMPSLPAGHIVTASEMNQLGSAATFLLNKPMTRVRDTAAGAVAITTTPTAVKFSVADFDIDGMWNSGSPFQLTIQTPGWYKVRYSVNAGSGSMSFVSWVTSTTGANNPAGAGVTSAPYWAGYAKGVGGLQAVRPAGSGIWPFYLYAGDFLQVMVSANVAGNNTGNGAPGSATNGGSLFSLEMKSI